MPNVWVGPADDPGVAKPFISNTGQTRDLSADALFFAGFNPEAILLLRQLRDAGWNRADASGDAVCGAAERVVLAASGEPAEGAAFSGFRLRQNT